MVFFFALAAKEVFEATLPGGPLASPRRAASPLAAAVGGMAAPALIYLALASTRGPAELTRGWAIPCATDIAFSAMVARLVFPAGHPAIPFLLLLAIADDALGLVILALFYPSGPLSPLVLAGLIVAALLVAMWLRRRRTRSFWPYVIGPGALSWAALYLGGFHPALALVPIVPFMPHGPADLGLFDRARRHRPDTLNRFEHWWAMPVQFVLLLFGFANAGVPFAADRTRHVLRACRPAARKTDRHSAVLGRCAARSARSLPQGLRVGGSACRRRRRVDRLHGVAVLRDGGISGWQRARGDEDGCPAQFCRGTARSRCGSCAPSVNATDPGRSARLKDNLLRSAKFKSRAIPNRIAAA